MTRPWYRSKWFRIGGVVLLLVLVVAVAIPLLVQADRFRPLLVRFIEGYTGRSVQIDALRLYLLPTVHLQAVNIRVKNPEGLPAGDMMVVKSVDLGIAPRALLSRSLVITYIAVKGVRVNLLRDQAGRTNYDLAPPAPGSSGAATAPGEGGAYFLSLGRIGAVTIRNVEVAFSNYDQRSQQVTPLFTLAGLNAKIPNVRPDAPGWAKSMELTSDLRGVEFSTPALAKPVQIQRGEFTITGGTGRGTIAAALEGTHAEGMVTVSRLDPLSITFTVTVPQLDLDRLGRLIVKGSRDGPDVQAAPPRRRLLARGDVKVGKILFAPLAAEGMNGRLSVYTDAVELNSYTLSFYGGTVLGAATLDYAASGLPAVATVKARGINLTQIMRTAAPQARKITGTLETDLRIATAFGRDPKATLTGAGTFAVRNGTIEGLDLKSNLAKMARVLQPDVPGGATRFSYFGGDLRIAQQRVHSVALRLHAEGLEGTARGSFGFDKTLDYAGTGVLKALAPETSAPGKASLSVGRMLDGVLRGAAVATGFRVPFFLRGTLDDPQFSTDRAPQIIRDQSPQQPNLPFLPNR
ncbi:MAG: AsmA family protein [bacterium]|nr:AsmA family protein [bacterium]